MSLEPSKNTKRRTKQYSNELRQYQPLIFSIYDVKVDKWEQVPKDGKPHVRKGQRLGQIVNSAEQADF